MFAHSTQPRPKVPVERRAEIKTLPPPVGGINDRDALISMPIGDAIRIENFICRPYGLEVRRGYQEYARLDTSSPVHSLFAYIPMFNPTPAMAFDAQVFELPFAHFHRQTAVPRTVPGAKLFAGQTTQVYDVTAGGLGPFSPETGPAGTYWTTTHFTTLGGTFLIACPIEGGYWYYDGATWQEVISGNGTDPNTIDGVNPGLFTFCLAWKGRLWFIEINSSRGWYLPPGVLWGEAQAYDFGTQFRRGGALQVLANWTQDAGVGIDDHLVALSAEGDVSIYKGTDPNTVETFGLVGVWYVGPLPVGNRQVDQYGGDLHILSTAGLTMLSALIRFGDTEHDKVRRTSKINNSLGALIRSGLNQMGWAPCYFASRNLVSILVPPSVTTRDTMVVQDVNTAGWSVLYDHPAMCAVNYDGVLFMGNREGQIVLGLEGALDDVHLDDLTGTYIGTVLIAAYNVLDKPGLQKMMKEIRLSLLGSIMPRIRVAALVNYNLTQDLFAPSLPTVYDARWDISLWDESFWSGGSSPLHLWLGVAGMGYAIAPKIEIDSYGGLLLAQYDWLYQTGGPL